MALGTTEYEFSTLTRLTPEATAYVMSAVYDPALNVVYVGPTDNVGVECMGMSSPTMVVVSLSRLLTVPLERSKAAV